MDLPFSSVQNDIIMMLVLGIIYTLLGVFIGMLRDGNYGVLRIPCDGYSGGKRAR